MREVASRGPQCRSSPFPKVNSVWQGINWSICFWIAQHLHRNAFQPLFLPPPNVSFSFPEGIFSKIKMKITCFPTKTLALL